MAKEFDWLAYKARVAEVMLPVIFPFVQNKPRNTQWRDPTEVAIDETVDIAIKLADALELRLKDKTRE